MEARSDKKIIVVTHASISPTTGAEVYGQAWALADYMRGRCKDFLFIRHPLNGQYPSKTECKINEKAQTYSSRIGNTKGVVRYLFDTMRTIFWAIKNNKRWDLYVGINGINTLAGIILKKLGIVKYLVFYTADYVPRRFENNILNRIYHWVDRVGIKNADYVWNISKRQVGIRRRQGVPDSKNRHVPHGAEMNKIIRPSIESVDAYSLVLAANLVPSIDYKFILDIFKRVAEQISEAKLYIIGTGENELKMKSYTQQLQLDGRVIFKGNMPHDELLKFLPYCGIGIAIYTNLCSWTEFSDSFKIKEYLACGCPVIASGAEAAIEESINSGAVFPVTDGIDSTIEIIERLLKDKKFYSMCRENAVRFMEKMDWSSIYSQQLAFLNCDN
ncbi:MAG: glycosyltransferase [Nitrospirae bacterium]|nr:glycosyltransferase [Nitrospirota bacterium]